MYTPNINNSNTARANLMCLPEIDPEQEREVAVNRTLSAKNQLTNILRDIENLRTNFSVHYNRLNDDYPELIALVDSILEINSLRIEDMSMNQLNDFITQYNRFVTQYNIITRPVRDEISRASQEGFVTSENLGAFRQMAEELNENQREILVSEVRNVFRDYFVNNTIVGSTVRGVAGEATQSARWNDETGEFVYPELEGWQRIAISPLLGLEHLVRNTMQLGSRDAWRNLGNTLRTATGMTLEDLNILYETLSYFYSQLDGYDKASAAIALSYNLVLVSKLIASASQISFPPRLKIILEGLSITVACLTFARFAIGTPLVTIFQRELQTV